MAYNGKPSKLVIPIVLMAVPVFVYFWYISAFGVNVMYSDEWALVPLLDRYYAGSLSLSDMFSQHNEHRIFFPKIVFLFLGLSKFFWININDPRIELAGVIQYTNLNPLPHLHGDHIIYLPQYLPSTAEKFSRPNDEIIREYLGYLKLINPAFSERQVKQSFVFRDKYAQPICEVGFTRDIPEIVTPLDGLYLTDSSQLHPDDRTISNSLGLGERAAALVYARGNRILDIPSAAVSTH